MLIGRKQVRFVNEPMFHYYYNNHSNNWWTDRELNSFKDSCIQEIAYIINKFKLSIFSAQYVMYQPLVKNKKFTNSSYDNISDITDDSFSSRIDSFDSLDSFQSMIDNDITWNSVDTYHTWKTVNTNND